MVRSAHRDDGITDRRERGDDPGERAVGGGPSERIPPLGGDPRRPHRIAHGEHVALDNPEVGPGGDARPSGHEDRWGEQET